MLRQGEVSDEELYEDFVAREFARVFPYQGEEMVGCVSVYRRPVRYAGRDMLLGGYGGVCVRNDLGRQGIGLALCREAHRLLEHERCDIAFLAAGPELLRLYEKLGFRWLGRFIYLNARGDLKETDDGMEAPVCSRERFEQVLAGERCCIWVADKPITRLKSNERQVSSTDPDSSLVSRDSLAPMMAHKVHLAVDDGPGKVITGVVTTPGSAAECHQVARLVGQHTWLVRRLPAQVVADKAYGTRDVYRFLHDQGIKPAIRTRRPWRKKHDAKIAAGFLYDPDADQFVCPEGKKAVPEQHSTRWVSAVQSAPLRMPQLRKALDPVQGGASLISSA